MVCFENDLVPRAQVDEEAVGVSNIRKARVAYDKVANACCGP